MKAEDVGQRLVEIGLLPMKQIAAERGPEPFAERACRKGRRRYRRFRHVIDYPHPHVLRQPGLTPQRPAAYHRAVLPKNAPRFTCRPRLVLSAALVLALGACATAPSPTTRSSPPAQGAATFIPSPED